MSSDKRIQGHRGIVGTGLRSSDSSAMVRGEGARRRTNHTARVEFGASRPQGAPVEKRPHVPPGGDDGATGGNLIVLILALGLALGFGSSTTFLDTANAVATVIYTHALPPGTWLSCGRESWNLLGSCSPPGPVALASLPYPVELVLNVDSALGLCDGVRATRISHRLEPRHLVTRTPGIKFAHPHRSDFGRGVCERDAAPGVLWSWGSTGDRRARFALLLVSPRSSDSRAGLPSCSPSGSFCDAVFFAAPSQGDSANVGSVRSWCSPARGEFAHGSNDGQKGTGSCHAHPGGDFTREPCAPDE